MRRTCVRSRRIAMSQTCCASRRARSWCWARSDAFELPAPLVLAAQQHRQGVCFDIACREIFFTVGVHISHGKLPHPPTRCERRCWRDGEAAATIAYETAYSSASCGDEVDTPVAIDVDERDVMRLLP